ncbi:DUF4244 domain-containing protein [Streptomyces sp. NPDC005963]|uniref:DUF4244 domain-containing protein n=1 Tax=Streptomyces sp. NPDC005963 TaxID=3156721 RepID=UPI0033E3A2E7
MKRAVRRLCSALRWANLRVRQRAGRGDEGMTTSEYAMGTIAACAFAAVLYKIVTSGAISDALGSLVGRALDAPF